MATVVSAEAIFDRHATALGLKTIGDRDFDDYVRDTAKDSDEGARCLREAFAAARVADNSDVHTWLAQARQHVDPRFFPKRS